MAYSNAGKMKKNNKYLHNLALKIVKIFSKERKKERKKKRMKGSIFMMRHKKLRWN